MGGGLPPENVKNNNIKNKDDADEYYKIALS